MSVTPEQLAIVRLNLPSTAGADYGWTDEYIQNLMETNSFSPSQAVRQFWFDRVNDTAEYMNINNKSLIQIHENAVAMLKYWDGILAAGIEATAPNQRQPISFGEIERPYAR